MLIFKCAFIILSSTYILSLCFQIAKETNSLDTGLAFLYVASGAIAGKIIYDRYQQIHVLGSLTPNPNVTSFANRIASLSASFLSLGFLVYLLLFMFKVDNRCLTALNIFICAFGTLYLWVQCIITTYISTLFYDKNLLTLRQCFTNVSFLLLIIMAIFGTITSFLPEASTSGLHVCVIITSLCSYSLTAIFCLYLMSFEKEYKYFAVDLRSELLLDDACSLNNASLSDVDKAVPAQGTVTRTIDKASNTLSYGTFGNINGSLDQVDNDVRTPEEEVLLDNTDSGMSSEENEDSHNASVYNNNNNLHSVSRTVDETKCLKNDTQCAVRWNEIPCCSKDVINKNVNVDHDEMYSGYKSADILNDNEIINSEFIVIDLTCDVDNACESSKFSEEIIGTNVYSVDCDSSSIISVESGQTIVPVANNEIVVSENQKLVSLSLSILLAALLQAMRCFAQFIEDIVIPQR
ncbi:unnamed protein product, partial [Iphiclides podalirius]